MTRTARFVRFGAQTRNSTLSPLRTDAPNRSPHFFSVDLSGIRGALDLALNIYQHGNRQVRKCTGDREGEVSVSRHRRNCLSREHVAILAGRKLLAQDDLRVSPGLCTQRHWRMTLELGKKPSGQHNDGGAAKGAGESDHVFILFSSGAQRHVAALGKQRAMFTAKTQRAAGDIELQAAVRRARRANRSTSAAGSLDSAA